MDILKLIYEHDMLLEKLSGELDARNERKRPSTLEEFMKPAPTYSRFYITGTRLDEPSFGIDQIDASKEALKAVSQSLDGLQFTTTQGIKTDDFLSAFMDLPFGEAVVAHRNDLSEPVDNLRVSGDEQLRDRVSHMLKYLDNDQHVIYKEKALNGFDIHIFSRKNLYESLFYPLRELISTDLRFFSINGKKVTGERFFYFETHRLERPPHGFNEVFPETVI